MTDQNLTMPDVGELPKTPARKALGAAGERESAEAQIATADQQIDEMQQNLVTAELQVEALEEAIRQRKRFIRNETKRLEKLRERRSIFIDTVANLRKLEKF